jgi:4'-phosphopantetheinyl transferase
MVRAELRRVSAGPHALAATRDACARDVLARATSTRSTDWQLAHTKTGRPVALHPNLAEVNVSVTHAADLLACAVSCVGPIGVDVEPIRSFDDVDGVRSQAFEPALNRRLDTVPPERRQAAFFEAWVTFEALGKVSGRGIVDWRCPDVDPTSDPDWLGAVCGADAPTYLWRGSRGALLWAVAVSTAKGRPLLAWRWFPD